MKGFLHSTNNKMPAPELFMTEASLLQFKPDVEDVMYVINFDFPNSSEDYIHRIGRTGRSTALGTAYTFFTHSNQRQARDLVNVLAEANQTISPELQAMTRGGGGGGFSRGGFRHGSFRKNDKFGGGNRFGGNSGGNSGFKRPNTYKRFE